MARTARAVSSTNIYHTIIRGINKSVIFEEESDYVRFQTLLLDCREKYGFSVLAYCFMNNHVHLLIRSCEAPLEFIFKSLEVRYSYWFGAKYQRSGHLFQNRYFSNPVESERSVLNTIRYIHDNPLKAGIVSHAEKYKWSSCAAYCSGVNDELVSLDEITELLGFRPEFSGEDADACSEAFVYEPKEKYHVTDEQGIEWMQILTGCQSHAQFQQLERKKRNTYIRKLHQKGVSVRQLVRICGITKSTVERIIKDGKNIR